MTLIEASFVKCEDFLQKVKMYVNYNDASPSMDMNISAVRKVPLCDDLVGYIGL